jgi:hypothetical protein
MYGQVEGCNLTYSWTLVPHGSYWSASLPLIGFTVTSTHWTRNYVGPEAPTETSEKENISVLAQIWTTVSESSSPWPSHYPRSEPQFHSQPAHVLVTVPEMNHNYGQPAHVLVTVLASHVVNNNDQFLSSVIITHFYFVSISVSFGWQKTINKKLWIKVWKVLSMFKHQNSRFFLSKTGQELSHKRSSTKRARDLLNLSKDQLEIMIGLLTGHCF